MVAVIDKQLIDFLDGGKYHVNAEMISETEEQRTNFAHLTNLGCEHHFGDLDSSQRRRPSASMHHHTSVQLLKWNRIPMMKWLSEMKPDNHHSILISARKGGREM
ncbi:hypothetical protein ACJMK2_034300 [Sinanodonta woodiana]|uniref:Uncharacterized protein n=1 Tax=Sinanodonta woodiana TaxID=1069815 RepID=A0ABD3WR43_SINWO